MNGVVLGFFPETLSVPLENLLPSREVPAGLLASVKYKQIVSSIREIGLIEPISISSIQTDGTYRVLDGHVRLTALRELGFSQAHCLIATDDESYTYNTKINRLSTIAEHRMLCNAVTRGVSEKRLARALNIDVSYLHKKIRLLEGICSEATELLKDRRFSPEITRYLRKMKPTRQVECVELMISANNLTIPYAEALMAATPVEQLAVGQKTRKVPGLTPDQMLKMQREMTNLQGHYKLIEDGYAEDVLNLVLARGYVAKLLANEAVERFIRRQRKDLLEQLEHIIETTSLER